MPEHQDPILLEVLRYELLAAAEEMLITMRRTTRSILAREGADYGTGLMDRDGRIIAQALPYGFIFFMGAVASAQTKYRGSWQDGDIIVTNDPYGGASHLPDIVVIKPIFWKGEHVAFVAVAEHHTDIGGRFPGGNGVASSTVYEEGLRLPAVRWYNAGRPVDAVREIIEANVRAPGDVVGDLDAGVAACRRGEEALHRLYSRHGQETIERYGAHLCQQSETKMRKVLARVPDGEYESRGQFDDGLGTQVDLVVRMRVSGDSVDFDYAGSSGQLRNALNQPPGNTLAKAPLTFLGLLGDDQDVVMNSGLIAPFSVTGAGGTFVEPQFPAAVGARSQLSHHIMHLQSKCLSAALPDEVPAAGEGFTGAIYFTPDVTGGLASGVHTEFFVSGWGARPDRDGIDGVMPMMLSGFRTASSEVMDSEAAVVLDGFGFMPDSGGPGEYRGTLSVYRRWCFRSDGRLIVRDLLPNGVHEGRSGGGSGAPSRAVLISDGEERELPRQTLIDLDIRNGDILEYALPGGGGFGNPHHREPARVLEDYLDGKVSLEHAAAAYGVVIDPATRNIDLRKTSELRAVVALGAGASMQDGASAHGGRGA